MLHQFKDKILLVLKKFKVMLIINIIFWLYFKKKKVYLNEKCELLSLQMNSSALFLSVLGRRFIFSPSPGSQLQLPLKYFYWLG